MNRENLKEIFADALAFIVDEEKNIEDVTTNLQGAQKGQLVFYKIMQGVETEKIFKKRFQTANDCVVVINRKIEDVLSNVIIIKEDTFLEKQKQIMDELFPVTLGKMKLVGVTGTNGKTSVVDLASQISKQCEKKVVTVGTFGVKYSDGSRSNLKLSGTTPSYIDFRKVLYEALSRKCDACVFEFSSHALAQDRIYDYRLDLAAWTNLSQDHLDYHGTMDNYYLAKLRIANHFLKPDGLLLLPRVEEDLYQRISRDLDSFCVRKTVVINQKLPLYFSAGFSRTNLELALLLNKILWTNCNYNIDLEKLSLPLGRFDIIELSENRKVIIDYAHTPDALKQLILCAQEVFKNYKCKLIFGCGGNRDTSKRSIMGEIAIQYADYVCITSDNPRDEDPNRIIEQICNGRKVGLIEENREKAITIMLNNLSSNEMLLIAGKGHEQYQEIKGVMHNYNDYKVVDEYRDRG